MDLKSMKNMDEELIRSNEHMKAKLARGFAGFVVIELKKIPLQIISGAEILDSLEHKWKTMTEDEKLQFMAYNDID